MAQYFGMTLDAASAAQMRGFLNGLRARLDLKLDLENGIVSEPLGVLPSDDELLALHKEHHAVVVAVVNAIKGTIGEGAPDRTLTGVFLW